jgi:hypothetical protein
MSWLRTGLLLFLLSTAFADTLRLKNGTAITANKISEKGDQVEYVIGSTIYYVPKAAVSSIERSGTFGVSIGAAPAGAFVPGPANPPLVSRPPVTHLSKPQILSADSAALLSQIVNVGRVDETALGKIEAEGSATKSAAANFLAAKYEYEHERQESARRYMKRAVSFAPNQVSLLEWYAILLREAGQYNDAIAQAEHAVQLAPQSAEALQIVGFAYYDAGRLNDAIKSWKRAQQLRPSNGVAQYLAKAERETTVEENFNESESAHFVLRYEGRQTGFTFRSDLLRALDRQYMELARDLGFAPEGSIVVILYTERQFFDVTQAPAWVGALNDGKLRIPIRDISGLTPQLEAVLKHELTHSFIHSIAGNHCPRWLNEGLAQLEEPRSTSALAAPLAELFRSGRQAPLRALEGSFNHLAPAQVTLAYAESLVATEYLRSRHGMGALRRMLELLGQGEEPEAALHVATQSSYSRVESELAAYAGSGSTGR